MSDVTNCLTCGAVCRILGQDAEGLPKLRAFQNTEAEKKIEQLKKSLHHLQETLRTLTGDCKSKDSQFRSGTLKFASIHWRGLRQVGN